MDSAQALMNSGSVIVTVEGEDFGVYPIKEDPATQWFRMQRKGRNYSPNDRLYLKIGLATSKEKQFMKDAKKAWQTQTGARYALFTVQPRDVIENRGRVLTVKEVQ